MPFALHWVREQLRSLRRRLREWEMDSMREAAASMHSTAVGINGEPVAPTVARDQCDICGGFTNTRADGSKWGWHRATCPSSDDLFRITRGAP
jgi:hypothetical protein